MIAPVVVFIDNPEGKDGEIAKVIGAVPSAAVTGVNGVATVPALIV